MSATLTEIQKRREEYLKARPAARELAAIFASHPHILAWLREECLAFLEPGPALEFELGRRDFALSLLKMARLVEVVDAQQSGSEPPKET